MSKLSNILSISSFSISSIDISDIEEMADKLPKNGVVDLNIAEQCMVFTLEGQNLCQEKIVLLDRWIGYLESEENKAWSDAALNKSKVAGHKTAKEKEWFAQADQDYIIAGNELTLAKACKKWFENKANYFSGWHYALKTFAKRDYGIESSSGIIHRSSGYQEAFPPKNPHYTAQDIDPDTDIADEIEWG